MPWLSLPCIKQRDDEYYEPFRNSPENVENNESLGYSDISIIDKNVGKANRIILNDRQISIREVSDKVVMAIS